MQTWKTLAFLFLGVSIVLMMIGVNQVVALPDLVTNAGQKIQQLIYPPPTPVSYESSLPQPPIIPQFNPANELPQTEVTLSNEVANTESDLLNEKITFSTIYLSLRKSCVDREIDLMQFTHWLTEEYLKIYGYEIGKTRMQCVFLQDFMSNNYDRTLMSADFVVFASNALEGRQVIEEKYFDGSHTEPIPLKILGHFNPNTRPYMVLTEAHQADRTSLILSHELAHMILFMENNPMYVDGVHSNHQMQKFFTIEYPFAPYASQYKVLDVRDLR